MKWVILCMVVFLGCSSPVDNKENSMYGNDKFPGRQSNQDKWYILADKEYGPVNLSELKEWCEQGRVLPDTLVRKGEGKYKCAKNFIELQKTINATHQDVESEQDKEIPLIPNITHGLQPEEDN